MRILFVVSGLGYGGAESQLMALAMELRRQGHEPEVYVLTRHAPRSVELVQSGVPVCIDHKAGRLDPGLLLRLRRHVGKSRPDVIHGFLFDGNWYATVAAIGMGVPVFCSERSSDYSLSRAQRLALWATRRFVAGLVANSERGRQQAAEMYRLQERRTHVVSNGLDLPALDERVTLRNGPAPDATAARPHRTVVLVGSFSEAKDQLLALEVARCLHALDPSWRMWLVGESFGDRLDYASAITSDSVRYLERVRNRLRELNLAGVVTLTGQRPDAIEIIAGAEVLLSTSRREGSPNVVLEAMAVGTPVVATEFSDIRRLLPFDWQVVEDRSPDRLAAAVCRAAAERTELAVRQRAWVEANATIEGAARKSLAIYAAHLGSAGRSGRAAESSP